MERLAFLFEMAWDFYQLENSLTIADIESEHHQQQGVITQCRSALKAVADIEPEHHHQQEQEMKGLAKFCRGIIDQLAAIYDPQLVPIRENGIIVAWISSRTGMQPWFS